MTDARSIIAKIRDGGQPPPDDLRWFAAGLASGAVTDAQAGAFAMAVLLKGLNEEGRVALTRGMRDSGKVMDWDLPGPVVDKHSTGGIGDCVSLLLAPALAVCGAYVPMISGRGLGHTGGTLDKLEAIPGFRTGLNEAAFRKQMADVKCAIVAASVDLAPADRRLYAIRDVSGTVESIDLITASILSKKLAAGLEALVLDVKCGSGAFMKTPERAEALARSLVATAQGAGCMTTALITDMSQPLATAAGNALEVIEVMETLTGTSVNTALWDLTAALGGEALALAGLASDAEDGAGRIAEALESGAAAEVFGRMVVAQGGPADFVERWPDRLPSAPVMLEVPALEDGFVARIDGEALGLAVVHLGGGRLREGDKVNPSVGLSDLAGIGEEAGAGVPLAMVHAVTEEAAQAAVRAVQAAYVIGPEPPVEPALVQKRIA
ncbi:thymidine phosphorylase [Tabrizicola sp.]|uniref:thymidine phosphorylase n=1 Tax=Tabrizicola sp. TaxID=2005166 RepID=UPI003F39401A